ncbi:hypothetical protein SteCoe_25721 [Stentor coeruleus]|uniref:Peptidase M16 C-terminal domain-containing protein n=1 Tax=Stentor coeruleus TaxID=5963 RepID=A0A1R2BEJ5_9CILI|nr:hypothetical protein SteCoe_25721 [Stentor coeruleus]
MLRISLRKFGFVHDLLGIHNTTSHGYIFGCNPPHKVIPEHSPLVSQDLPKKLQLTTLSNGVRIVTESEGLPSSVHLGVTISTGVRDETEKYSGVVHALSQTYLKTNVRTNEQINYGMIQMSGGEFNMTYDHDFMNYHGFCLAHDTYDIMQMLSDCVLDEKTIMDEEAAQWRTDEYWKLRSVNMTNWKRLNELWLSTAYGFKGYGMPLSGFESNFQNLGHYYMNQWRKHHATPDRMTVWGAGVKNHAEFVDTVTPYFVHLEPSKAKPREASKYLGGDHKEICDSSLTHVSFSFQGPSRVDKNLASAFVLKYILGNNNSGLHSRAYKNFAQKYSGIEAFETDHEAFADTGNFRINLAIHNDKTKEVCEGFTKEFLDLANVTDEEVTRAKNLLINTSLRKSAETGRRTKKSVQGLAYTGKLSDISEFVKEVEAVTKDSIKQVVEGMRKSRPTVVALGGSVHDVPNADSLHSKLR